MYMEVGAGGKMVAIPITEIIRQRSSVRTYDARPITEEHLAKLREYLAGNTQGPLGTQARFILITASAQDRDALNGLATYGFIRNPAGFIIGAVASGRHDLEDFGYLMEKNILYATELGLGTCWVGGTFSRSRFADRIGLRGGESVPAVTPIGYGAGKRAIIDAMARWSSGSAQRKPWEELFFSPAGALSQAEAGRYAEPLEMVRLAPSASNYQPWRVLKEQNKNTYHFFLSRRLGFRLLLVNKADLQRVDMGIAMCHFELTAQAQGLSGTWTVTAQPRKHPLGEYTVSWVA